MNLDMMLVSQLAVGAFFAILFLQSGIDKVTDRKGNLDWMTPHFAQSPLKSQVGILLSVITLFELASGAACAISLITLLTKGPILVFQVANLLVCATLLQLFLGQRLAKDYPGAASLAGYFVVSLLGLGLSIGFEYY